MSVEFKDMDFTINNLLYDLTSGKYIPIPPQKKKKKNSGKYIFLKIKKKIHEENMGRLAQTKPTRNPINTTHF